MINSILLGSVAGSLFNKVLGTGNFTDTSITPSTKNDVDNTQSSSEEGATEKTDPIEKLLNMFWIVFLGNYLYKKGLEIN